MADLAYRAITRILLGFVTGQTGCYVLIGWWLRRHGDPTLQGRRAALTIWSGAALCLATGAWLIAGPWL